MGNVTGFKKAIKRLNNLNKLTRDNMRRATLQNAIRMRDQTKLTIRNGRPEWADLSGATINIKGSSKPLIDHGDLMNSISLIMTKKGFYFIGVPRTVKNEAGVDLINIGKVMEFGATIKPKKAQALTIPLSREASRMAKDAGGVKNIPNLFRPKGTRILALPEGDGFKPMFVLMKQVVIPPRPFITTTYNDNRMHFINNLRKAAKMAVKGRRYIG